MSYKVIVDSCGEFTPEMKADGGFEHVALGIQIEDTQWTDDDSLKQEELLLKIAEVHPVRRHPVRLRKDIWKVITAMPNVFMW